MNLFKKNLDKQKEQCKKCTYKKLAYYQYPCTICGNSTFKCRCVAQSAEA